jgi:urease accessory protein UreE
MWGNTLIIDRLIPPANQDDLRAKEEDKLVLAWEERRWLRGRFMTAQGRKIGIALPTGTTIAPGSILHVEEYWYLRLEAAIEPVLEIVPSDYAEAVIRLMERLGVPFCRRQAVFDPVGSTQLHQHAAIS